MASHHNSSDVETNIDIAPVGPAADVSRFQISAGDRVYRLREGRNVIGRDAGSDVVLETAGISRRHACITIEGGRASIEDIGSKNGTFVGSVRITAPVQVGNNCAIRLGTVWLVFHAARGES